MEKKEKKQKLSLNLLKDNKKKIIIVLGIIFVLIIALIAFVFFNNYLSKKNLSNDSIELFKEAKKMYLEKNLDKSIELLKNLTGKNKKFLNGYFMLGKAYFFNGQKEEAKKTWEKILKINPDHINTLIWLGILYDYEETPSDKAKSEEFFCRVLDLDGMNLLANYNMARIYFNKKEYKKALYFYNNALENEMHLADIHIDLAKMYKELELNERVIYELSKAKSLSDSDIITKEINNIAVSLQNTADNKKVENEK